jgi:ABC-type glutathione transport system ATPase component
MRDAPLLDVRDLVVAYGRRAGRREILHGVDLHVDAGETVGIIGETGSGKTTLARAVLGLVRPERGAIEIDGASVAEQSPRQWRAFRRRGLVQYVFQDPLQSLDPDVPVGASVGEGLAVRGDDRAAAAAKVAEVTELVGLSTELLTRLPGELSGGQRQRFAIARALALDPRLIVLDEPVSALDAANRIQILELLPLVRVVNGIAQLFISHDLGSIAGVADRVVVLYRGEIVEHGPTRDVIRGPHHPYTRLLVGSAPSFERGGVDRRERAALRARLATTPT